MPPTAERGACSRGERPIARGHHRFKKFYVTAFVSPATGESFWYLATGVSKDLFEGTRPLRPRGRVRTRPDHRPRAPPPGGRSRGRLSFRRRAVVSGNAARTLRLGIPVSLGAPILLEEAAAAGAAPPPAPAAATPACDHMKAIGQWNAAWDPFFALDSVWTDQFMATGAAIYGSGVFTPKETELLSIAFDASFTHMYAPGARRHIRNALAAGASVAEIMEVLKLSVAQGIAASNLGVTILAEDLMRREETGR